jgi:hypothetical protein
VQKRYLIYSSEKPRDQGLTQYLELDPVED